MGTKVQCKSYLPGYLPTRDVNEDANFNWSPFSEDKTFSRHLYRSFQPQGLSSWAEYDKETLKRTMLQHEATFRNQVNELHRLYRIQKELMHELKRKQLNSFFGPTEISRSSTYRSQVHPEFNEKIRQPPLAGTYRGTTNGIDSRDKRAAALSATQFMNGGYVKNDEPGDIKIKKFAKRTLDLHLPADAYIEEEDSEKTEGENVANALDIIHDIEADNDVQLTLGSVEVAGFVKSTAKSNLHFRNSLSAHRLADLNIPFKDSSEDGDGGSCTHKFSGVYEFLEGDQRSWTPIRSNTCSRQTNIFKEKVELRQEWKLLHNCSEQSKVAVDSLSSALFIDKHPMSSESVKLKLENAQETQLPDQKQTKTWFQEKGTHSTPIFGSEASQVASSLSAVPSLSHAVGSAASWAKPTKIVDHIPVAVRAPPCFGTSSMLNGQRKNYDTFKQRNNIDDAKLQCDGYGHLQTRSDDKPSSPANDHHHAIQVNSLYGKSEMHEPRKCLKGLNFVDIKYAKELSLSQGTDDESSKGLVWLQESSPYNGYANKKECNTQVDSRSSKYYSQLLAEFYGSSICSSKYSVSSFDVKESKIQKDVIPDSLESAGNFSISCNSQRNLHCSNSVSFDEESSADYAKGFTNCSSDLKKDINLNSELMPITDSKPTGVSPGAARKRTHEIDLEAPADELEEVNTFSDTEAVDINPPEIMLEISQEKISFEDIHLRSAADAIVSISMAVHSQLSKITIYPSSPSSRDSLHLLAEVAAQDAESYGVPQDDGSDAFESMTLKLEEIKPEQCRCKPHQQEKKPKDDEKSAASMLLSRPRRGQARKRRQKKDFQKDVLPALASLSRYEVTEDLQALGGITRASKSRQTSSTGPGTRQNQSGSQTRGKRRPRSPATVIVQVCDAHPQEQPIYAELESNGRNMMTWGRTTRRCPRQRVGITGNSSAAQST